MCVVAEDQQAALKWARMAMDAFIGSPEAMEDVSPEVLKGVNVTLREVRFDEIGRACQQFARAMAIQARTGKLDDVADDYPVYVHGALAGAECRNILIDVLVDDSGRLRQAIAGILAQSYNESGELEQWIAYCANQAASAEDAALAGDWALAGQYAEGLRRYESPRE
jgi:hypothetical protein